MIVVPWPRYSRETRHDHGFGWGFRSLRGLCWLPRTYRWAVAGSFGDSEGVRRLGQALIAAGRGLAAATDDLSGRVRGLIPSGWSGSSAEAFGSDWNAKAGQAGQLAAVCNHAGQILTALANQLDAASGQAAQAQQMTGGPASRFALPAAEQQVQQMLSQASGGAQQARAAARAKLAGIAVPRIGPALTVSQVDAWAERIAPPQHKSAPWYDTLLHGAESGGLSALKDLGDLVGLGPAYGDPSFGQTWVGMWHGAEDFSTGFVADGLLGTLKGLGDLAGLGPAYGDPSFVQTWGGMGHLVEPWNWNTFTQSWESLGKGLLAWDEWKSDPARAEGQALFSVVTLPFVVTKALDAADAAAAAAKAARAARLGETANDAGNASKLGKAATAGKMIDTSRLSIGPKIARQIATRGWTRESIDETVRNPAKTVATRDTRWKPDGTRMNAPATAYMNKDGSYIVVNDQSGDIVQVSNRNDPDWKAPWG
jgi:hypothetical protein